MARLEYFVVAESSAVDQRTNQVSVFNIYEALAADTLPVFLKLDALGVWRVEPGDSESNWQVIVRLRSPSGEEKDFSANIRVREGSRRHRVLQRFEGFPITEPGAWTVELLLNGESVASHEILIQLGLERGDSVLGDLSPT